MRNAQWPHQAGARGKPVKFYIVLAAPQQNAIVGSVEGVSPQVMVRGVTAINEMLAAET